MTGAMHEAIVVDQHKKILMLRAALISLLHATMFKDHPAESQQAIDALAATALATEDNTLKVSGL